MSVKTLYTIYYFVMMFIITLIGKFQGIEAATFMLLVVIFINLIQILEKLYDK